MQFVADAARCLSMLVRNAVLVLDATIIFYYMPLGTCDRPGVWRGCLPYSQ